MSTLWDIYFPKKFTAPVNEAFKKKKATQDEKRKQRQKYHHQQEQKLEKEKRATKIAAIKKQKTYSFDVPRSEDLTNQVIFTAHTRNLTLVEAKEFNDLLNQITTMSDELTETFLNSSKTVNEVRDEKKYDELTKKLESIGYFSTQDNHFGIVYATWWRHSTCKYEIFDSEEERNGHYDKQMKEAFKIIV